MDLTPRDKQLLGLLKAAGSLDAIRLRIISAQVQRGHYESVEDALRSSDVVDLDLLGDLLARLDPTGHTSLDRQLLRDGAIDIERLVGEEVAGYRLERLLGQGAMGVVYYATPTPGADLPDEPRAIKLLKPGLGADPRYLIRFLREARTMEGLRHPGLVRAHGHGVWGEIPFMVMEYVRGEGLDSVLARNKRLLEVRTIWLALKVLPPLQVMHDENLVHRDLKPSNIIIDRGYGPRITDFGVIAETASELGSGRVTRVGTVIGTGGYVPPELTGLNDPPGKVDGRADLYSLGCVLYACLTGHPPFFGLTGIRLYAAHVEQPPPPLRPSTGCSAETEAFVMQLLAKRPADRPATAATARRQVAAIWRQLRASHPGT